MVGFAGKSSSSKTIYFRKHYPQNSTFTDISLSDRNQHYFLYDTITLTHHHHYITISSLRCMYDQISRRLISFATVPHHFSLSWFMTTLPDSPSSFHLKYLGFLLSYNFPYRFTEDITKRLRKLQLTIAVTIPIFTRIQ